MLRYLKDASLMPDCGKVEPGARVPRRHEQRERHEVSRQRGPGLEFASL